ncbi:MAG: 23S rRNA (uracil(1939)-C(5))-methyltransferase RlmD, partial [Oscillospiraceae bacterium]|nr:23S rRNA (uracil(1939)-C(5))-methyltransferase RlmD [Oscillospiraceae bacterium]
MAGLLKNQVHTVTITGYSAEGLGVARIDGQVVFVHGGIRREVCTVRILKVLKQLAFGRVEEILEESPARRAPDCPHFPACGGCALRHISYAEELDAKRQWVEDALRRVGGVETEVGILGADAVDGYRNKAIFPVSPAGQAGFYRARSHDVIPAVDCCLQTSQANAVAQAVEAYLREEGVPAYDERSGQGLLRHIYVRTSQAGRTLVCLAVNGASLPREAALAERIRRACPQVIGVVLNTNTRDTNVVLGDAYRTIWGEDTLTDTLCGLSVRLSVPSFYQVNRAQAERLYQKAVEFAGLTGRETVLELYCGAGTITMVMARHAAQVIGAEIVPEAVENAQANARANGVENVSFLTGDAGAVAAKFAAEHLRPDVVVVDPPRKGLEDGVATSIAAMGPERVVYVSCNPGTLARDVKRFRGEGYSLVRAAAVDMFPRTVHVETVCLLSKLHSDQHIEVELQMDELDLTSAESKATYEEIKDYVL